MPNDDDYDYLYRVGENSYQDPWNARTLFGPRENRALTSQETVDVVGASPVDPGPPPIMNRDRDYHPADMREGLIEKGVKWASGKGGNYLGDDRVYLEQYLHPERDIIPKQPLRPTNMRNPPNMEFRRVPDQTPLKELPDYRVPNVAGLGQYTTTENDKYTSVYDTWDFDTKAKLIDKQKMGFLGDAANWAAKKVMQNVGTPFAVYERIPKTPDYGEKWEPNMMANQPGTATPLDSEWQSPDDFYKLESTPVAMDKDGYLIIGKPPKKKNKK